MQKVATLLAEELANANIFSSLTIDELIPIAKVAKKIRHPAGTALFTKGETASHFFFIVSGSVRLYRLTADGKEKVIEIIQTGETFAEAVALVDKPYPINGQTIEATEMIWIPASMLKDLIEQNPTLAFKMMSGLSMRLHKFINDIYALSTSNAEQKVAGYFLSFLEDDSTAQTIHLPSKKTIIASRLGLQPETFSRVLRKMKTNGVIAEDDYGIIILQPKKFKEIWAKI